ncbi:MAG TPA: molybdopterin oxidoreductase family protein [Candidatus Eisenbacteria bacterium]|nr:molybdopterin oxidoreductase family protein [Candidatus Eisenbacteria bacterium]
MKRVVHAACPHDCPDACGTLITVEEGRATKVQGDPAHPVTQGFLCAKVAKYLDRVYSPDRLLYPMRRVAPKGTGGAEAFQRISWDKALDEIVAKLKDISAEFGPEAVLPYSYGGNLGVLNGGSMDMRFFYRAGASQLLRTICATTGGEAIVSMYGRKVGTEPEQFRHAKYIIAWGANIHGNNIHLWPFVEEARRNGAKLVVIDPYRTRTAKVADWHIPINPSTDVALAMGLMHVIVRDGLQDADYVARYAEGFDELQKRLPKYTPKQVSAWTGVSEADIELLAHEYATMRPAAIRVNYGIQRTQNGGAAMRAVCMLPVITGSWKELGGGLQLSTSGAFELNTTKLERADLMLKSPLGRAARCINMVELGKALTEVNDPPVKALFVYNSNPAAVCPEHNLVVRGLKRDDLFTVVHEQFFTDTTDYADVVLPATTFFEHKDLVKSYGHLYLQVSQQAINPLGQCKSNVELFRELALRMGFEDDCFRETVDEMIEKALSSGVAQLDGITRERLEHEPQVRLNVHGDGSDRPWLPFANGFPTPNGKARLYDGSLIALGMDPVAEFVPPEESRHTAMAKRYPLELLARKADNFLNSTFVNLPSLQKMEQQQHVLEISRQDAERRGIRDGDRVRVFNERGEIVLQARVDGAVAPGVVGAKLGWAKLSEGGVNVNVLTSARLADLGGGATFYSTLVEVERVPETSVT